MAHLLPFLSPSFPLLDAFVYFLFTKVDLGMGLKPPGYYIQRSSGLFPAPIPLYSVQLERVCLLFELLGMFLAKCVQDGRRVDIPLSLPFFKLMCTASHKLKMEKETESDEFPKQQMETLESKKSMNQHASQQRQKKDNRANIGGSGGDDDSGASAKELKLIAETNQNDKEASKDTSKEDAVATEVPFFTSPSSPTSPPSISSVCFSSSTSLSSTNEAQSWFSGILTREDMTVVDTHRGQFLQGLYDLVCRRDGILNNDSLTEEQKQLKISELTLDQEAGGVKVEDL